MAAIDHNGTLDLREQIARIDDLLLRGQQMREQMAADQPLNAARLNQMLADHDRKRQEIRLETWKITVAVIGGVTSAMAAGAALFAAGAAYMKLFS
jgi:hypothetical protein